MGFQLFGGKFYRCVDADFALVNISLVDNKAQCLANASLTKYQWTNRDINFDNALYGFLALFQTVSKSSIFLNMVKPPIGFLQTILFHPQISLAVEILLLRQGHMQLPASSRRLVMESRLLIS